VDGTRAAQFPDFWDRDDTAGTNVCRRKRGADGRLLLEAGSGAQINMGTPVLRISLCEHSSGVRVVSNAKFTADGECDGTVVSGATG